MSEPCPNCSGSKATTDPLCRDCWDRLPAGLQQRIAHCLGRDANGYAIAVADATEHLRAWAHKAEQLRTQAAARSRAQRTGAQTGGTATTLTKSGGAAKTGALQ